MTSYPFNNYMMPQMNYAVPSMTPNTMQPTMIPKTEIPRVANADSIRSYPMGPDSSMVFFSSDPNSDKGWLVTTDSAAYKNIIPCRIIPDVEEKPLKASDLDARFAAIEEHFNQIEERISANEQHAFKPIGNDARNTKAANRND